MFLVKFRGLSIMNNANKIIYPIIMFNLVMYSYVWRNSMFHLSENLLVQISYSEIIMCANLSRRNKHFHIHKTSAGFVSNSENMQKSDTSIHDETIELQPYVGLEAKLKHFYFWGERSIDQEKNRLCSSTQGCSNNNLPLKEIVDL